MRTPSLSIRLLLPVQLSAPLAVARAPRPAVPDVGPVDGEHNLTGLTPDRSMNIDVTVMSLSRESETLPQSAAAVQAEVAFGLQLPPSHR